MDLATLIGLVGTRIVMLTAIVLGGSIGSFIDPAAIVLELLAADLDPARLMVSGHADTQPRAANDTAAHRALNRRVDITFANGRDRPGNWAVAAPR